MPDSVLRTVIHYGGDGPHDAQVVTHWAQADDAPWTVSNVTDFMQAFEDETTGHDNGFKASLNEQWSISKIVCTILADPPVGPFEQTIGEDGTGSGTPLPPNCTYLVKLISLEGGRSGRGRMFLPGVGESSVATDGTIESSVVTGITSNIKDFLLAMAGLNYSLVIFSRVNDVAYELANLSTDSKIATQRRRLR